jgi:hypothetical protein
MNKAKKRKLEAEAARGGVASARPSAGASSSSSLPSSSALLWAPCSASTSVAIGRLPSSRAQRSSNLLPAAPSGPDDYGRYPGDEHYGHDHPVRLRRLTARTAALPCQLALPQAASKREDLPSDGPRNAERHSHHQGRRPHPLQIAWHRRFPFHHVDPSVVPGPHDESQHISLMASPPARPPHRGLQPPGRACVIDISRLLAPLACVFSTAASAPDRLPWAPCALDAACPASRRPSRLAAHRFFPSC